MPRRLAAIPSILIALAFAGCGDDRPPPREPPPARVEVVQPAPAGQVWVEGHWVYRHGEDVWVPGHWESRPRPEAVWVPGHYAHRRYGYEWVPGHWRYD
jgi:hypothetical protein